MRKKRVTLQQIADKARVGVATVDRVLNRRARVSSATARRVLEAAEALDYHAHGLIRRRVTHLAPPRRLGFILQKENKWYYRTLAGEIRAAADDDANPNMVDVAIAFVDSLRAGDMVAAIDRMAGDADAIALVSIDHPQIASAIRRCTGKGIAVFSMLSPLSCKGIAAYIGIDSRKAGRTAGWGMANLLPAPDDTSAPPGVGVLVGSHRYLGHEALESGFRDYMAEHMPQVVLKDSIIYLDDSDVAEEAAAELLASNPGLAGIYHCGGGARGVLKALKAASRAGDITYICHDKSPAVTDALAHGIVSLVIATPLAQVARRAVALMLRQLDGAEVATPPPLEFSVITPENI